jgi:hypothetical protein
LLLEVVAFPAAAGSGRDGGGGGGGAGRLLREAQAPAPEAFAAEREDGGRDQVKLD